MLGAGEEQSLADGVFANSVHEVVIGNSVDDLGPGFAVVGRLEDVRLAVVVLVILHRDIRRGGIVRGSFDEADAPEIRQARRRDLGPMRSLGVGIAADVDQAVVGPGPDGVDVFARRRDGEDGAVNLGAVLVVRDGAAGIAQRFRIAAREVVGDDGDWGRQGGWLHRARIR